MSARIVHPWPDKGLSPNVTLHYMHKHRLTKAAREAAGWATITQLPQEVRHAIAAGDGKIPIKVYFYPPNNIRRDADNMVASAKALFDGVADGLMVNDHRFDPHYFFEAGEKPGRIEIVFPSWTGVDANPACGANQRDLEKGLAERCANTPGHDTNAYQERDV